MNSLSSIDFLLSKFKLNSNKVALIHSSGPLTYGELYKEIIERLEWINTAGICNGDSVILIGDYGLETIAILLALVERRAIVIPLTQGVHDLIGLNLKETVPKWEINAAKKIPSIKRLYPLETSPDLYEIIQNRQVPGLVLFTSGSSGRPKAVVHDFSKLLKKFHTNRPAMITLNFLLFDHWGGLNTLFHALSNLCLIVFPNRRTPESVCGLIEKYRIEILPATPSFLNMLLISREFSKHDLSSLKVISYGAEPMPEVTLTALRINFPNVELRQTYGMIELGVLRAKSRSTDSLWVKVGGEGYILRIVDDILQIKAESAMLGYINAISPFTEDGYLITGDLVEQDGEWIRILGRQSDIINVGGQKVYPSEVESVILGCSFVMDAVVYGEKNQLTGKIVAVDVVLNINSDMKLARKEIMRLCRDNLQPFMVPMKINFVDGTLQTERLKRSRVSKN